MDRTQARHARAMANKIREHSQHMSIRMKNLVEATDKDFEHVPVENVENVFNDLKSDWNMIQRVIQDMLGELR